MIDILKIPALRQSNKRLLSIEFLIEKSDAVLSGVGLDKKWSSSDFLAEWGKFWNDRKSKKD